VSHWSPKSIITLWIRISDELGIPCDREFGAVIWTVFSNNNRVLDIQGDVLEAGSFRGAGSKVASICGGDYMDYYMSNLCADQETVERVRGWLRYHGFILTDWDEWERGIREGRYKRPEWME